MIEFAKPVFYITTAIDYVNAAPHLGHAYEKICADVIARWKRLQGSKVWFLTGTDENAQKNAQAAKEKGVPVKEFVDKNSMLFIDLCSRLNLSNDDFIRTTEARHVSVSKKIFKKIFDAGDIYKGAYEGHYCYGCEAFKTERDLVNNKCPEHPNREIAWLSEETYFFKLSKYQDKMLELVSQKGFIWPEHYQQEIVSRLKLEGLKDLSVTRKKLEWGITTPIDKEQKIYVWIDALVNYISALGYPRSRKFKTFWPASHHLIGKGINWFHSVIWPSILMSAGIEPPKSILVHGYINLSGKKLSKTAGIVIDPIEMINKYGADRLRYYLSREVPFGYDGDFSEDDLVKRTNGDLADGLGNLLNRTLVLIEKASAGMIRRSEPEGRILDVISKVIEHYVNEMDSYRFNSALEKVWFLVAELNRYINEEKPWEIKEKGKVRQITYNLAEGLRVIALLAYPFIPDASEKIFEQLGLEKKGLASKNLKFGVIKNNTKTKRGEVLFKKIEIKKEPKAPATGALNTISFSDFEKLGLKVGTVKNAEPIQGADKLLKLVVDVGEERQLVAGIAKQYKPEELIGKQVVVVTNLQPAKLRGVESNGMVLAADVNGEPILISPDKKVKNGLKIA